MSPTRRQASYTLPRNFTFHYSDDPPRTPERPDPNPLQVPPSPPRQPYRLRRRRAVRQLSNDYLVTADLLSGPDSNDVPIPTIEVSDIPLNASFQLPEPSGLSRSYSPRRSPPRTPCAQVIPAPEMDDHHDPMDMRSQGESISRPSTACSGFSDSSVSSSIESFPSLGGSFTSPESEVVDRKTGAQTLHPSDGLTAAMQPRPMVKSPWTDEMDKHLWMVYMRYLQDPTHTPFKMLPGTAPPLGVCSRVVREAKRTWKGSRTTARVSRLAPWAQAHRADSPDTIRAQSGNTTPTDSKPLKHAWPRSDAATRRRLRQLCRRKPSLSAHYNRLLSARSPSPHLGPHRASGPGSMGASPFSTREMNVSLMSCSASAIATLGQMPAEETHRTIDSVVYNSRHQKSQSLDMGSTHHADEPSRLASPFRPVARTNSDDMTQSPMRLYPPGPMPRLAPPMRLSLNRSSLSQGLKRPLGGVLNQSPADLDGGPVFPGISSRRIRTRGFSLGDVNESSRRLTRLFDAPPIVEPMVTAESSGPTVTTNFPPHRSLRRLGSPFSEKPAKHHFNTFPRNFSVNSLAPTPETQEERFDIPSHAPPAE